MSAIIYPEKWRRPCWKAIEGIESMEYIISMDAEESDEKRLSFSALLKKGRKLVAAGDRSFIDAKIDPDAMSILLFTSGTTGLAKGVMLSHKKYRGECHEHVDVCKGIEEDVALSILPIHHTYEFTILHMTVHYQGGTVALKCEGLKYIIKIWRNVKRRLS